MTDAGLFRSIMGSQMDAALWMLCETLRACPEAQWEAPVGRYPFWMVAYHVLCFADFYSAKSDDAWTPDAGPSGMHPRGRAELEEEFPSRRFQRDELLAYLDRCRAIFRDAIGRETAESLAGPSGFPRLRFSRAELYLHSLRHVQHHTGQLSAMLRRVGVDTRWGSAGWIDG